MTEDFVLWWLLVLTALGSAGTYFFWAAFNDTNEELHKIRQQLYNLERQAMSLHNRQNKTESTEPPQPPGDSP